MKAFKKVLCLLIVATLLLSSTVMAGACTTIAVGKDASADGSTMISHSVDGWYDERIEIVPGGTHAEGEMVEIYNDPCMDGYRPVELSGEIPQVAETYTYFDTGYPFMNEKGVTIGEHTWSGDYSAFYNGEQALFVIANLQALGLQRASTARECVEIMGALAEEYGYADGGECLLVGDANEVWIFEISGPGPMWTKDSGKPGAHWAARRVPDDQIWSGANRSRLGVIDFNDTENYMWSTDITALPEQMGWWSEGEDFNYTDLFNPTPYGYPFYASRREWRAFSLLAPSQNFELVDRNGHYDFSIVPDEAVTVQNIMDIYSDHLEGTEYDMTQGLAAGPFHNPTRWQVPSSMKPEGLEKEDWEREIAQFRCSYSFVAELRPDMPGELGTVLWFGEDSPDTTVYTPIYAGTTEVPEAWSTGDRKNFDQSCSWWAFNLVNNYANLNWDAMYPVIRERKAEIEAKYFEEQADVDAKAMELYNAGDIDGAKAYVTEYVNNNMNQLNEDWWNFAWELLGHYYDGMRIEEDGSSTTLGYPTEWLEAVGFASTSVADQAKLAEEEPAEEAPAEEPTEEVTEPETPEEASETPAEQTPADTEKTEPAVNTTTNNNTALIIGIVAAAAIVIVAVVVLNKKKKN